MFTKKLALLSTAALFCAGLAMAQAPDAPQHHDQHHRPDPTVMHKSMCEDRQAHAAATLAYVEARLELTDAQKPLFAKWRQSVIHAANKQKTACLAEAPPGPDAKPTVIEREKQEESRLQARLQTLQSTRPSLQAFYDSLTDGQKDSFNRLHAEHGHGHEGGGPGWGHGGEFMHRPD